MYSYMYCKHYMYKVLIVSFKLCVYIFYGTERIELPSYSVQKTFLVSWNTQRGNGRFIPLAEVCLETSPPNSQNLTYDRICFELDSF